MENPKIKPEIAPFKRLCMSIGAIPTSFQDSMDYYECVLWLIKYLENTVIPVVNNNGEAVAELQELYITLKNYVENYFENLDVQEEINNKLDEMAESGQLAEIIAQYLNTITLLSFDTLQDLIDDNTVVNGSFAQTLGYYSVNDGGASVYKITNVYNSSIYQEDLGNGLYANLINFNSANVKQYGAKGDGTTNDNTAINNALKYNTNVIFTPANYLINGNVYLYSNLNIDLNNATLKTSTSLVFLNNEESVETGGYGSLANISIKNGELNGTLDDAFKMITFRLLRVDNIHFENIKFINCSNDSSHIIDMGGCSNVEVRNCIFSGSNNSIDDTKYREMIQIDYSSADGMPYWSNPDIVYDNLPCKNIYIDKCKFLKGSGNTYFNSIGSHAVYGLLSAYNINITNCEFDNCWNYTMKFPRVNLLNIENNIFYDKGSGGATNKNLIYILGISGESGAETSKNINIRNNYFYQNEDNRIGNVINLTGLLASHTNNINIESNIFYGNWTTGNTGAKFLTLSNVENIYVNNNILNNCRIVLEQDSSGVDYLYFTNNNVRVFSILRNKYDSNVVDIVHKIFTNNNYFRDDILSNDTNTYAVFGFEENVTATANHRVPLDTLISGSSVFTAYGNGRVNRPGFLKNVVVSGAIEIINNSASAKVYEITMASYVNSQEKSPLKITRSVPSGQTGLFIIPPTVIEDPLFNQLAQNTFWFYTNANAGDTISNNTKITVRCGL